MWRFLEGESIEGVYRLRQLLGEGSFGGVFLADHVVGSSDLRRVAVKLISTTPETLERQLEEARQWIKITHPHVVACHHVATATLQETCYLYLVLELAEYTLHDRLEKGTMSEGDCLTMATQLFAALSHLHARGLVHRDVKPANLLWAGGVWKMSDLGTIRLLGQGTEMTEVQIGTMNYMPPESLEGFVSSGWDIWSTGILLQRSLTGKMAYVADTLPTLIFNILHGEPWIDPEMQSPFIELVRGCITKDRGSRWTAARCYSFLSQWVAESDARQRRLADLKEVLRRHRVGRQWPQARDALEELRRLAPGSADVAHWTTEIVEGEEFERMLGRLRQEAMSIGQTADLDNAVRAWNELLRLEPQDREALDSLSALTREKQLRETAQSAINRGDYECADDSIRHLLASRITGAGSELGAVSSPERIQFGECKRGQIGAVGSQIGFEFQAAAGDVIFARLADLGGSSIYWIPCLEIRDPTGQWVVDSSCQGNAQIGAQRLESGGVYSLIATNEGNASSGRFALFLQRVNRPGRAIPIGPASDLMAVINSAAEVKTYTFAAEKGDQVTVSMSGTTEPHLELYDPNGHLLGSVRHYSAAVIDTPLNQAGSYTILAFSQRESVSGAFRLTLGLRQVGSAASVAP
jgi:hypothetical protein